MLRPTQRARRASCARMRRSPVSSDWTARAGRVPRPPGAPRGLPAGPAGVRRPHSPARACRRPPSAGRQPPAARRSLRAGRDRNERAGACPCPTTPAGRSAGSPRAGLWPLHPRWGSSSARGCRQRRRSSARPARRPGGSSRPRCQEAAWRWPRAASGRRSCPWKRPARPLRKQPAARPARSRLRTGRFRRHRLVRGRRRETARSGADPKQPRTTGSSRRERPERQRRRRRARPRPRRRARARSRGRSRRAGCSSRPWQYRRERRRPRRCRAGAASGSRSRQRPSSRRTAAGVVGGQRRPVRLARQHRGQHVAHRLAAEKAPPRQHLEEHDAERPDVGALVHRLAARLLRRHVGGGAEDEAGRGAGAARGWATATGRRRTLPGALAGPGLGEAEVEHLDLAVRCHLHVRGLEVAVDDALLVRLFERLGDLLARSRAPRRRAPARASGARRGPRPGRAPSRGRGRSSRRAASPRRNRRGGRCSGWLSEASSFASRSKRARRSGSAAKAARQQLERDVAPELRVRRAIDLAHAAGAERCNDVVGAQTAARGQAQLSAPRIVV